MVNGQLYFHDASLSHGSMVISWSILFLLVSFISSCKVGKEYQRPELELPKQFNDVSFADTSSIADIEWKKFFTILLYRI